MATTSADTARSIAHQAAKAFAGHALTQEGPHWRCGRPGDSSYSFRLYAPPGAVIVWGDLGECVLRHADSDSPGWLVRAAGRDEYPDYCLGKIEALDGEKREFYVGDAKAYIRERLRDARGENGDVDTQERDRWKAVARDFGTGLDDFDSERAAWRTACIENGVDDPPDCYGWSSSALWIWHALVTFVRLHQLPVMGELAARNLAAAYYPNPDLTP